MMFTAHNDNATPHLDSVFAVLSATLAPSARWALRGWADHMREMRHQNHAANSWAKHRDEFGELSAAALALVAARCIDYGMEPDEVMPLLDARIAAREAKRAA